MWAVALIFAMQLLNADMVRDPETPSHLQMPAVTATFHVDLKASPPRNASITVSAHANIAVPARNASEGEGRLKAKETQRVPPIPLPPREKAELLEKLFGLRDKVPVLVIGSMTHEFFTARQSLLFNEVFHQIKNLRGFKESTVFVGHSANGRTPPEGRFADWQFRGSVFDCIPQERAHEMIGADNSLMLTFEEKDKGDFNIMKGPHKQKLMLGPESGVIKDASGIRKEGEVQVMRIQVPDIGALPDEQPPQWNGVANIIEIALVLGGGPRAIQEVAERDGESDFTKEVDAKARLTRENYPYKPNALFVFAVGGLPAGQIMDSGPEQFKPGPVSQEHWLKLIDKDEVAHFASTAEPDEETGPRAIDYAENVARALGDLVEAAFPRFNGEGKKHAAQRPMTETATTALESSATSLGLQTTSFSSSSDAATKAAASTLLEAEAAVCKENPDCCVCSPEGGLPLNLTLMDLGWFKDSLNQSDPNFVMVLASQPGSDGISGLAAGYLCTPGKKNCGTPPHFDVNLVCSRPAHKQKAGQVASCPAHKKKAGQVAFAQLMVQALQVFRIPETIDEPLVAQLLVAAGPGGGKSPNPQAKALYSKYGFLPLEGDFPLPAMRNPSVANTVQRIADQEVLPSISL